jgi:hypothetical protein
VPRPDDPKVVLQAHALRTRDTRHALVHGSRAPRLGHGRYGALIASSALAIGIVIIVFVVARVVSALHHR